MLQFAKADATTLVAFPNIAPSPFLDPSLAVQIDYASIYPLGNIPNVWIMENPRISQGRPSGCSSFSARAPGAASRQ
jgi:hypothetical protein